MLHHLERPLRPVDLRDECAARGGNCSVQIGKRAFRRLRYRDAMTGRCAFEKRATPFPLAIKPEAELARGLRKALKCRARVHLTSPFGIAFCNVTIYVTF